MFKANIERNISQLIKLNAFVNADHIPLGPQKNQFLNK
jgi:hypothetical protein